MAALLAELPKLAPALAASDGNNANANKCRTVFLQLLGRLLELDSKLVLDASQVSFGFVLETYLSVLALR